MIRRMRDGEGAKVISLVSRLVFLIWVGVSRRDVWYKLQIKAYDKRSNEKTLLIWEESTSHWIVPKSRDRRSFYVYSKYPITK